jgi:hypothetical protein
MKSTGLLAVSWVLIGMGFGGYIMYGVLSEFGFLREGSHNTIYIACLLFVCFGGLLRRISTKKRA